MLSSYLVPLFNLCYEELKILPQTQKYSQAHGEIACFSFSDIIHEWCLWMSKGGHLILNGDG